VRGGNRHPNIQPQDVFPCADGFIVLAVGNDGQFAKLVSVLGHDDWATHEQFSTNASRVQNHSLLDPLLRKAFANFTKEQLINMLGEVGVPCAPINTVPEVFEEPQIKHRKMLRELEHPLSGVVPTVASPLNFVNEPLDLRRSPPLLGEHTDEILQEFGLKRPMERR
jgi:crotonobetainyl-CoA:carnitine CoA-transferase CaiB-like acyl-CoA transferase